MGVSGGDAGISNLTLCGNCVEDIVTDYQRKFFEEECRGDELLVGLQGYISVRRRDTLSYQQEINLVPQLSPLLPCGYTIV